MIVMCPRFSHVNVICIARTSGKTESGLKKHKIRYHRSRQGSREESHPVDAKNSSVKFKDSGKRKVIDAWHVKNVPSDGNNGNSLKRHKTNGYVIDN